MSLPRPLILIAVVIALAGLAGLLMLRSTPLDKAIDTLEQRNYFFDEDRNADPGLSTADATSRISEQKPSLGPVAGFLTHDSRPTRRVDLEDQPVYLFVVDEFHDHGPIMPGGPPPPAPHAVFVYAQGGAESVIAIPLKD